MPSPRTPDVAPSPAPGPLDVEAVARLLELHFPQLNAAGKLILIEAIETGGARVRLMASESTLRPGGTISGPSMVLLADVGAYIALLGARGDAAIEAVTTSLSINFLSRPRPGDLLAHVRLLKVGRRLAVAEVDIHREGETTLVAHATATYAMPPEIVR